jgi:SSS family solute:Na+ symporter
VQLGTNVLINYILIFFILFLFLVLTRRLANKTEDKSYFVMLKSQKTLNLSLSFYASGMGLWIIASPAEVGWYGLGFDVIGYAISAATPFVLLYFVGPRIVQTVPDKATLPQYISQQYGNFAQVFVSIIATIYMSAFLIAEFASINFLFPEISKTSGLIVCIAIAVVTFLYLNLSGFKASLVTDRFQGVSIIALLIIVLVLWISQNGIGNIIQASYDGGLNTFTFASFKSALAVILAVTAAEIFSQGYWQRTYSAIDESVIKKSSIYAGLGCFVTVLILGIAGSAGAGFGIENPSLSFIQQIEFNTFSRILVIVLCTMLVASSIDTLQSAISSTMALDLVKRGVSEAKIITLIITFGSLGLSFYVTNIFSVFLFADLLAVCLVFPAFYKIKSRKTSQGIVIPTSLGFVSSVLYRFYFIDLDLNPGGIFIPTDLYGLADLNTFGVGFIFSIIGTLAYNRIK